MRIYQRTLWVSLVLYCFSAGFAYNPASPYQNETLRTLEKQFIRMINQSARVIHDPVVTTYLNQLAVRLAPHHPVHFFVVNTPDINAFAGPGGYIGLNTGLILATHHESELAAVMAHEIAHEKLHHLYQLIAHQESMQVPMLASVLAACALGIVNPSLGSGALLAALSGHAQEMINITRAHEAEADRIGIQYLKQAKLNPEGMVQLLRTLQAQARYSSASDIPTLLRTHPLETDRLAEAMDNDKSVANSPDSLDYGIFKDIIRVESAPNVLALLHDVHCTGYCVARTYFKLHHFHQAAKTLAPLLQNAPDVIAYVILNAQIAVNLNPQPIALQRLITLQQQYPKNYALAMMLGQSLLTIHAPQDAYYILLKTSRLFPHDLPLCTLQAMAAAHNKQIAMAYFIKARCDVIQGNTALAIQHLRTAKKLAQKDAWLQARIQAKIVELT